VSGVSNADVFLAEMTNIAREAAALEITSATNDVLSQLQSTSNAISAQIFYEAAARAQGATALSNLVIATSNATVTIATNVAFETSVPRNAGVVTPAWMFGSYILTGSLYMAYLGGHQAGIYLKGGFPDETDSVQLRAQSSHFTVGEDQCGPGVYSNGDMLSANRVTWTVAEPTTNYHAATKAYVDALADPASPLFSALTNALKQAGVF
jgi:hypothetical protein